MRVLAQPFVADDRDRLLEADWSGRALIFDSFEGGLSDKSAEDRTLQGDTNPQATLAQKKLFASRQDAVADVLRHCPFVTLHPGVDSRGIRTHA